MSSDPIKYWYRRENFTNLIEYEIANINYDTYLLDKCRYDTHVYKNYVSKTKLNGPEAILEKYRKKHNRSMNDISDELALQLIKKWSTQIPLKCDDENLVCIFANHERLSSPTEQFQQNYLKILDVSHNLFTEIPKCFSQLINLEELNMSFNLISEIPEHFDNTNLILLQLENNKITKIPNNINNLLSLRILNLSNNYISEIPIITLPKLRIFNLSYNNFSQNNSKIKYNLGKLFYQMCGENYIPKLPKYSFIKSSLLYTKIYMLDMEKTNRTEIKIFNAVDNVKHVNDIIDYYQKINFRTWIHRIFYNIFPEEVLHHIANRRELRPGLRPGPV
jgi:hypothetical protein